MNPKIKILVQISLLVIAFATNVSTNSQTLEEKVSYSQENADSSDYNYKRKYYYLDINMKEENNLFTIGIASGVYLDYYGDNSNNFSLNLVTKFDKKIFHFFSVYPEIITQYVQPIINMKNEKYFSTTFNIGMRYYYMQKRSIKMGTASPNFNGPYIDIKFSNILRYGYNSYQHSYFHAQLPDLYTFSCGYQQKLTKYLFIDGSIFGNMSTSDYNIFDFGFLDESSYKYNIGISFKMGFGLGWK
jgi:hypothetical protein